MAKPRLAISRRFQEDPDPKGKVFPFHLTIPGSIDGQEVVLHPSLPISSEIIQAKAGHPKKYCVKAFCTPADAPSPEDIKVQEVFWDRIDSDDVELELDVQVVPAISSSAMSGSASTGLTGTRDIAVTGSAPTASFRTTRRYEDMPVDDP